MSVGVGWTFLKIGEDQRETYKLRKVYIVPNHLKETLSNDESPGQNLLLCLLFSNSFQDPLQVFHVVVLVPLDVAPRGLQTVPNRIVDHFVGYDNITTFAEGRKGTGYSRKSMSIYDAALSTKECGNIGFGLHVDILSAVELRRTAWPDAICAQSLYGFLLDGFVGIEIIEIVGGEIGDGFPVR